MNGTKSRFFLKILSKIIFSCIKDKNCKLDFAYCANALPLKNIYKTNLEIYCIPFKLKHYIIHVHTLSAASYWLFVVNGPTPVVKARIEEEVPNLESEETNWPDIAYRLLKT